MLTRDGLNVMIRVEFVVAGKLKATNKHLEIEEFLRIEQGYSKKGDGEEQLPATQSPTALLPDNSPPPSSASALYTFQALYPPQLLHQPPIYPTPSQRDNLQGNYSGPFRILAELQ